ncbi:hypothetical protein [Actinophytocola algeriensis]|uniref:Uncharacterized protein n=1 Tax=Actinophytocola algeriensis TaxID=1768010 RepID=A0A7W7QAA8_9PSEU|nr:hypothetical protein [Actinophytocola algeriensis]MBB4909965.1 hypothetical protein [Actinophytocola algeriensis]MBE1475955.1 hypothetical protein [Actinophytocola algeriensis]
MRRSLSCAAVLSVFGALVAPAAAVVAVCTPAALPGIPGVTLYEVTGTDYAGTYVARGADADGQAGVIWQDGEPAILPNDFVPYDMNRSGVMSGNVPVADLISDYQRAALMTADGTITYLSTAYSVAAAGLNENGDSVGWLHPEHPVIHFAAVWPAGSTSFEVLDPYWYIPLDVDDQGYAIGEPQDPAQPQRIWRLDGTVVWNYGPYPPSGSSIDLADIDDGTVAAKRTRPDGRFEVVLIDAATGAVTALPGSASGTPLEIENGVVVGKGPQGATMWRSTGATVLPAPAGLTTREATAVNGDGTEVAGISTTASGDAVATVWRCV